MTKVKVQDATRELSAGASQLLENFGKSKRQTLDMLHTLRKMSDDIKRQEVERREQIAKEALAKQYEEAAAFMTAFSTDQVPEPVEAPAALVEVTTVAVEPANKTEQPSQSTEAPSEAEAPRPIRSAMPETPRTAQAPQPVAPRPQFGQPAPQRPFTPQPRDGANSQQPQQRPFQPRPVQGGQQPQYGRPVQPAQQNQYARPVQPGQPGQYARPVQPGQPGQYGRPVQPGQPGQYGRPVLQPGQQAQRPQPGQQGQFNRPMQPGGQYGRPAQSAGPYGRPAPGAQGGQAPYGRPQQRPAGGAPVGGRPGFGRKLATELTPVVEKERVSNYDPNKKQYVRQVDPERAKKTGKYGKNASMYDDDMVRGKRKRKPLSRDFRPEPIRIEKAYMTAETITVKDLTERLGKPAGEIIKKLMLLGIIATINNELDFDTAQLVASEFGIEFELKLDKTAEDVLEDEGFEDQDLDLIPRPPVVTIMGHVDHGKTSLLDHIRHSRVTAGEAGGITQHIGAYTVSLDGRPITFLDTPGHEAFTAMRARGAQVTDIAILVVAADDGVMPQTIEAINHAKAAGVQTIVAINKIDRPNANPERIMQELTEYGLVSEEWGGDTIMVPVSATTGENVDRLLEMILLVAELQNYRANPNRKARGAIIEARLDKGRGPVATVLIKNGTLNVGDTIVAGTAYGRVRAMVNDRGEHVRTAGPSDPVEVIGFNDVPDAGDMMSAVDDDRLSRAVAEERKVKLRTALIKSQQKTSLDDLFSQISAGQIKDLNLIIKADVQGSVEAVKQSLERLSNDEVRVRAIHGGVGAITEGDIMLASASDAIIIGFNVRYDNIVRDAAEREKVEIRLYRIIYTAIEEIQAAMKGMLAPKFKENVLGRAQVRNTFRVTGVGTIAGCYVTDGKLLRNAQARLLRDNVVVTESRIESLKRFKDDAREVATGYECGVGLENYNDVKEGDVIECFEMVELER